MKKILLFSALLIAGINQAQTASCNSLVQYAKSEDPYPETANAFNSTMLAKTEYYEVDGGGLVIAYIKKNEYDFRGSPYIFCGISYQRWSRFKTEGMYGSWGEAFHKYIMDYTCDCN